MNPAQSQRFFKIGEAAKKLGLSSETLRRWERAGKISFSRSPGGKRLFSEADLEAVRHLLDPKIEPTQTSTQPQIKADKITLSVTFPKLNFPQIDFAKVSIILAILLLISGNIFFFSQTPYSHKAVLGVETFIAPAVEEVSPIIYSATRLIANIGNVLRSRASTFLVALLQSPQEPTSFSLPPGIKVDGNNIFLGIGSEGTTRVNNNFEVVGSSTLSDLLVSGSFTVEGPINLASISTNTLITTSSASIGGNLILSSTSPILSIENTGVFKITDGTNTLLKLTDNGTTGNLETSGDLKVSGNITLSGVINSNTFSSTKLVFAGDSPTIYAGTTNTGISLNANGTGAISIGNSSTGDIYLGGGSSSSTRCFVSNSNGNLTCSGDLAVNGGDITSSSTAFNFLTSTVTTLNIGSSSTTIVLAGTASFTKAPTSAHTGTWAINSSTWNVSNATLYINPSTATADSNLLGVAVNGNVKFDVDAEGDIYGNNLVLAGNTTTASTTVSGDLTVEGNTTLGDATTDTLTINPATVTFSGGNKTLDLTGAATRTLTILNSTASQIADIDLSDGNLKVNGSTIITNAGAGSFTTVGGTITTASQTNITAVGTLTSLAVTGNVNSSSGSLQSNGVTRIDNSGNLTAGTGSFSGAVTPGLDATYDFGSAVLRWNNAYFAGDVTAGDVVFKNNFRLTENGDKGIDLLNPRGEKIASFDEDGNFWVKGRIEHGN